MPAQGSVHVVRFGEYELDLESSELRKHHRKIPLPDQALRILAMLLERPGEVITREQIIARLWPNGMVVEFDHGINSSVRRLRAALNDSAERPRYIETLQKRGYRFIFLLRAEEAGQAEIRPSSEEHPPKYGQRKWLWIGIGAFALLVLAGFVFMRLRTMQAKPISSIAILPLVNSTRDPNTDYLSDGISEEIINTLSAAPPLRVIARTSAFRFKGKQVDPQKAGRELGVGAVLTGTLARQGNVLVIQTDLIKVSDGSELWGARYNRQMSELQAVQSEIALEVASKLRLKLAGDEEKRLAKRFTENSEAYALYLKAAHAQSAPERIAYLNQSIAKDPNFALAYSQLARGYASMGDTRVLATEEAFRKVKESASKALELDGRLGEAHLELAWVLMNLDWKWQDAERELKRGIDMSPNSGHIDYSFYLTIVGRPQEALIEAQRAEAIDPLSAELQGRIAFIYYMNRQHDRAIEKALAPDARDHPLAQASAGFALAEKGRYAESISLLKPTSWGVGNRGHIGYAYARAGNRPEAERICRELEHLSAKQEVGAYEVSFIDAALGKKEEAFKWLDIAYHQHDSGLKFLKVDPCLDTLRSDPRFNELIRRVGLAF
jgi:TolB-like protein/DNA-binding winged helix-turn-helix (wHTH) protein